MTIGVLDGGLHPSQVYQRPLRLGAYAEFTQEKLEGGNWQLLSRVWPQEALARLLLQPLRGLGPWKSPRGHGTEILSIFQKLAPQATILWGKVLDEEGEASEESVLTGLQWLGEQKPDFISLSLGCEEVFQRCRWEETMESLIQGGAQVYAALGARSSWPSCLPKIHRVCDNSLFQSYPFHPDFPGGKLRILDPKILEDLGKETSTSLATAAWVALEASKRMKGHLHRSSAHDTITNHENTCRN